MGGGLQRAFAFSKGHVIGAANACLNCKQQVEHAAKSKKRCPGPQSTKEPKA